METERIQGGPSPRLRCPGCGGKVEAVPPSKWMNSDQWDAVKAGDYFCEACPDDGKGATGFAYWTTAEVEAASVCTGKQPVSDPTTNPTEVSSKSVGEPVSESDRERWARIWKAQKHVLDACGAQVYAVIEPDFMRVMKAEAAHHQATIDRLKDAHRGHRVAYGRLKEERDRWKSAAEELQLQMGRTGYCREGPDCPYFVETPAAEPRHMAMEVTCICGGEVMMRSDLHPGVYVYHCTKCGATAQAYEQQDDGSVKLVDS